MRKAKTELIIFTGAGASQPLGYPTTNKFFLGPEAQVWQTVAAHLHTPSLDVEDILSILDDADAFLKGTAGIAINVLANANVLQVNSTVQNHINNLRRKCFENYGHTYELQQLLNIYKPLFDNVRVRDRITDFFTTNYDPTSEGILELVRNNYQISWTEGFDDFAIWSPALFNQEHHFRLFRLHGSMCYVRQGDRIRNTHQYEPGSSLQNHMLLFPGYKGNPNEAEEIYRIPHQEFVESLAGARFAFFVGVAFRDKHINEAIVQAQKSNPNLRIVIINPDIRENIGKNFPLSLSDGILYFQTGLGEQTLPSFLERVPGLN